MTPQVLLLYQYHKRMAFHSQKFKKEFQERCTKLSRMKIWSTSVKSVKANIAKGHPWSNTGFTFMMASHMIVSYAVKNSAEAQNWKHTKTLFTRDYLLTDLCGKVFKTCKRLLSHKTRSKETCKLCNFVACNHHIFVKHLTTHDPLYQNNAFSCEVCGYRARKRVILKTHIKVVHEKFRLSCDLCEFKSKDKSAIRLREH